jgi:arylsulfatase A-like enzyme
MTWGMATWAVTETPSSIRPTWTPFLGKECASRTATCELAGAEIPADRVIDGASILPAIQGKEIRRTVPPCWMFPAGYYYIPHMAVREGDYVLIGWFNNKQKDQSPMDWVKTARIERFELYNINVDVEQAKDLAEKESDHLERMSERMKILWSGIQAEGPTWEGWK